jgi:hypothetical protein
MTRYVWTKDGFRDPATGEAMPLPARRGVCAPSVVPDTPAYRSPITGEWIEGRKARREDLKKHGCVEAGDLPRLNGGRVKSEKFAKKHGLRHEAD